MSKERPLEHMDVLAKRLNEALFHFEALLQRRDQLLQTSHGAPSAELSDVESRIAELREGDLRYINGCHSFLRNGVSATFRNASDEELNWSLRHCERYLNQLPSNRDQEEIETDYGIKAVFPTYRRFLEEAIREMREVLSDRGPQRPAVSEADRYVERVSAEIKKRTEIIRRLNEAMEADIAAHPEQEDLLRRTYRRAIDAVREEV